MINTVNTKYMISTEKQYFKRLKQIAIMYGTGRPIYNITMDTQHIRANYDGAYYMYTNKWKFLENKNFVN